MAFRWFKKSELIAGAIVGGFMAVLFLALAFFGESLGGRMIINAQVIQKSDPEYAHEILMWRIGMSVASLFCVLWSWISYWGSRRVSE
ncbi:MAG TPA: hypothetical protein PLX89_25400 [Verrucomicrobiota bacterium]|nr:hypothetical protein [Verrucomicrobiales bacterium]HRI16342.1 hypothetical protein [Verrucomicrobiota bacterium]